MTGAWKMLLPSSPAWSSMIILSLNLVTGIAGPKIFVFTAVVETLVFSVTIIDGDDVPVGVEVDVPPGAAAELDEALDVVLVAADDPVLAAVMSVEALTVEIVVVELE